jgi:hypothetical protein
MGTFLRFDARNLLFRGSEAPEQSIDDSARVEQLREGGEACGLSVRRPVQIGPCGRDQRSRTVRQDEHE